MPEPVQTDARRWPWQQFRLANGLRLLVSVDHGTPIAAVNLWYDVGSRHEITGQHGFAHLFEHLMFEGSAHVGKSEHFAALQAVGASNINATTNFDRTNYFETVPVEHLELALWLEADRMGALELTQATLDNQREVVKNERRQRYDNQPYGNWVEETLLMTFPDAHPYRHSVIGSMQDLSNARLEHFQRFYNTYYAPNNAVLSVVGAVDPERTRELVERYFGGLRPQPDIPPAPDASLPRHLAGESRKVLVESVPMPRFNTAYRTAQAGTREHEVLSVLTQVLGSGRGCRLYRELVQARRLAQPNGGFMGSWDLADSSSLLVGSATTRSGVAIEDLEAAYHEVVAKALAEGFGEDELDRARAQISSHWYGRMSTVAGRADALSGFVTQFDDPERLDTQLDRLMSVSLDELVDVGREVIRPDARAVLTYQPAGTVTEEAA